MRKKKKELIPTPEDRERVEEQIKNGRDGLMETLVRYEARQRMAREEAERRRQRLNRLSLGLLGRH
jgi:chromatin segregation and condensation protein Rec8/ScpA/Scc1 (kleisin family)